MTLWDRSVGFREVELRPFYTLTTISYNNEALRTLLMNVILFLPFGLTIPYVAEVIKIRKNNINSGKPEITSRGLFELLLMLN